MTSLEKLDAVLKSLEKHNSERHHDFMAVLEDLKKDKSGVDFGELKAIVKKLHKDELIDIKEVPVKGNANPDEYYYINFDGRVLNEQNGYVGQKTEKIRLTTLAERQASLTSGLFWLTVVLAVSTAVAALHYGLEIRTYFCPR